MKRDPVSPVWRVRRILELALVGAGLGAGYCWATPADAAISPANVQLAGPAALTPAPAPAVVQAPPPPHPARPGAESPELAQLLRDEEQLFPPNAPESKANGWQPSLFAKDSACSDKPDLGTTRAHPCLADRPDWLADLRMPDLPVRPDEDVRRYVRYFSETNHGRKIFGTWLRRSGRYRQAVTEALRERGLPQDLHALVFVESGYSPAAVSSANAVGLWQFIPSTGKAYGLSIDPEYDERRSIKKASAAGAHHLADLYDRFGSWDLAFAAYNMGYQGLLGRMRELGTEDFWELAAMPGALPRESALYVPKILAVAVILRNLDRFGFDDVHAEGHVATSELEVPPRTPLALVARAAGTSLVKLRELNPELLRSTMPAKENITVHVPSSGLARARALLPQLIDPVDRDGLENKVSASFDWGKDELPKKKSSPIFEEDREEKAKTDADTKPDERHHTEPPPASKRAHKKG